MLNSSVNTTENNSTNTDVYLPATIRNELGRGKKQSTQNHYLNLTFYPWTVIHNDKELKNEKINNFF